LQRTADEVEVDGNARGSRSWIPAFAGMTDREDVVLWSQRTADEVEVDGNARGSGSWIPAFAGMTDREDIVN
jgi:hypothetical protein